MFYKRDKRWDEDNLTKDLQLPHMLIKAMVAFGVPVDVFLVL